MRFFALSFALLGCASQIRTEFVGTGTGVVTTRTAGTLDAKPAVTLPRGTYDIDLRFNLPRAQLVEWKVTCPGVEQTGRLGESFETYRDRRLMELRSEWTRRKKAEEDAREAAENTPPTARTTTTRVRTPVGAVTTTTTRVVGPAPIPLAGPEPTALHPGDLGGGTLPANTRIDTTADGACSIVAVTDDPDVMVAYQIIRIRDLRAEASERRQTLHAGAITTRSRVSASLVANGADAGARARRLEAEAKQRAEAERLRGIELAKQREVELRVSVERQRKADEAARADAERRRLAEAARLEADRQRAEADRKRAEAERLRGIELMKQREIELRISLEARRKADEQRRLRLEAEARLEWEREAPMRARAELLIKQRQLAITTRVTVIEWLVGTCHADPDRRGAIARRHEAERLERERLIAIRIETERVERERLIRIKLEAERVEREKLRAEKAESDRLVRIKLEAERVEREKRELAVRVKLEAERVEREKRMAVEYLERQRLRDEAERARIARIEAENARRAKEAAALAELELRRTNEALRIRTNVVGSLVTFGAKVRPPRPAPLQETPGTVPFDGAVWTDGSWAWVSARSEWVWTAGGWRDSARFGNAGHSGVVVVRTPPPVVVTPAVIVTPPVVEPVGPGVTVDVNVGGNARGRIVRDRDDRYSRDRRAPQRVRDSRDNAPDPRRQTVRDNAPDPRRTMRTDRQPQGNATRAPTPPRKDDAKDDKRR